MEEKNQVANGTSPVVKQEPKSGVVEAPKTQAQVQTPKTQQPQQAPKPNPAPVARPAIPAFAIVPARKRRRYLNMLVYGDYGVGKSFLIATASEVAEMRGVLYISAEGGDLTVEDFDIDVVSVYNYGQFARVHEFLRLHCKFRDMYKDGDKEQKTEAKAKLIKLQSMFTGVPIEEIQEPQLYYTVCVDSLSEVQKYCMYQLLGIKIGEFALDTEPETPQWSEWGKSAEMIRLLVRSFRDLPMNALFVCARSEEQDHQKKFHYKPLLPGKLANEVQGFFDVVGYYIAAPTEGGEIHRRLYLEPGQTFQAKNRFRDFTDRYIDNPSMADLAKYRLQPNQ